MNLLKMSMRIVIIFACALLSLLSIGITSAEASVIPTPPLEAQTSGGNFMVDTGDLANPLTAKTVVRRAILSLPPGETGMIDTIAITGPTPANPNGGGRVFGCANIKVQDGLDLIKACGGPAELLPGGNLRYQATGSGFGSNVTLKIALFDDFNGES